MALGHCRRGIILDCVHRHTEVWGANISTFHRIMNSIEQLQQDMGHVLGHVPIECTAFLRWDPNYLLAMGSRILSGNISINHAFGTIYGILVQCHLRWRIVRFWIKLWWLCLDCSHELTTGDSNFPHIWSIFETSLSRLIDRYKDSDRIICREYRYEHISA